MVPKKIILDISDNGLFQSVRNGDQKAFREIYERYWSKLYHYAFNVLHESQACEDIIQEIFATLWTRRNELEITNLSSYLYQSVKFQVFKQFRQSKYKQQLLDQLDRFQQEFSVDELTEYKELSDQLAALIAQLPEKRQLIFYLSRDENLSNKEIAEKLQISVQTVKNEISRALKFLRTSLKNLQSMLW